jgi:hypothetical protein
MNINLPIKIIAGLAICTATLNLSSSVKASSDKYSCQKVNGIYGVYSRTERGDINLLTFTRDVSQDWSVDKRCNEVATRFQRFYDNGILSFIGADFVNKEPVLCAVKDKITEGKPCNSENVLVTLPPQSDPVEAARQLMDTRGLARGRVIDVNGGAEGKLETYINGNTYYDLAVLEQLIMQQKNSDRLIKNE